VHEAPHRVRELLVDLAVVAPDWRVCVGREVTKVFEEFRRGTASELAGAWDDNEPRGEFTLVVAPPPGIERVTETATDEQLDRLIRALLAQGVTARTLATALAEIPGITRKAAYARVLALAGEQ
jgi:16S rRNA (cytidine1402-2'-O)-methyltransferase